MLPISRRLPLHLLGAALAGALGAQSLVKDIVPPLGVEVHGDPSRAVIMSGVAYFTASDSFGRELWRSDGTTLGTYRVKDINPGSSSSNP